MYSTNRNVLFSVLSAVCNPLSARWSAGLSLRPHSHKQRTPSVNKAQRPFYGASSPSASPQFRDSCSQIPLIAFGARLSFIDKLSIAARCNCNWISFRSSRFLSTGICFRKCQPKRIAREGSVDGGGMCEERHTQLACRKSRNIGPSASRV